MPSGEALESRAQGQSVLKPRDAQLPQIVTRFRPPRGRALRGAARALSRFARTLQALWTGSDNPETAKPRPPPTPSAIQAASRPSATEGRLRRSSSLRGSLTRPRGESSLYNYKSNNYWYQGS